LAEKQMEELLQLVIMKGASYLFLIGKTLFR
jgi:hypothetical protein